MSDNENEMLFLEMGPGGSKAWREDGIWAEAFLIF